jgi:membrane-associated phospholipid phosphatase
MMPKISALMMATGCSLLLQAQHFDPKAGTGVALLHRAEKALTSVIVHDIFSPPVASRIYLYANAAAYEAMIPSQKTYKSLSRSLSLFPVIPDGGTSPVNYELTALYAFLKTAEKYIFSEAMLEDSLVVLLKPYKNLPAGIYQASISRAQVIIDSIGQWAAADHYKETRKLRRYSFIKEGGKWLPTPPGYMAAVEPYWSKIRPVALDSAAECRPVAPLPFSKEKGSSFYRQAYDVYTTGSQLSAEQRGIALFWDCNPFFLNTQGHLNFATKKLSPGGHWMSIAGIAALKTGADFMKSAAAYLLTSIALYDGFISCWEEKFRSNLIRPETYINANINEAWRPLLQTPPFPEYTSGHSVISTAAALALTNFFGEGFSFDDTTETPYGLPVRKFPSFAAAAAEAAISRFYGGIHYMASIENGQVQGRRVGEKVLEKIKLR